MIETIQADAGNIIFLHKFVFIMFIGKK